MATEQEREYEAALKREEMRLKKEPFKTMVEVEDPNTINELRGWQEPRRPYVLMESRYYDIRNKEWKHGLCTINCDGQPAKQEQIQQMMSKGYRIIHYAYFPSLHSPIPEQVSRARLYSEGTMRNPWAALAKFCDDNMNRVVISQEEISALKKKVEEYERQSKVSNGAAASTSPASDKPANGARKTGTPGSVGL